jgi:hypothetical protein
MSGKIKKLLPSKIAPVANYPEKTRNVRKCPEKKQTCVPSGNIKKLSEHALTLSNTFAHDHHPEQPTPRPGRERLLADVPSRTLGSPDQFRPIRNSRGFASIGGSNGPL